MSPTQIIALSFVIVILIGALALTLPISSATNTWTSFFDALFTATSATCVTGLIVVDTFTHWSTFGQLIIIILIQIGGLGFMTMISMVAIFLNRKIGLSERQVLVQSAGNMRLDGIVHLVKRIFYGTVLIEGIGAALLAIRFVPLLGPVRGIWYSIFHSISAFCNAGFDLFGFQAPFSSLTAFEGDVLVNVVIMGLIIVGGLGFFVWSDLIKCKFKFKPLELHTKIVLTTTAVLVFGGALLYFIAERNYSLAGIHGFDAVLGSIFQSVTARTAGFNTLDLSKLSTSGSLLMSILMVIGGSPGSTAGGFKTTTLMVVLLTAYASIRNKSTVTIFNKRFKADVLRQASSIVTTYIVVVLISVFIIGALEPFNLQEILFEVTSAVGTVGCTMGITTRLSQVSQFILIVLMYMGRVGIFTLGTLVAKKYEVPLSRPESKIIVG